MQKAYHANLALRLMVIVPGVLMGGVGLLGVWAMLANPTGRTSPGEVAVFLPMFGLWAAGWLGTAVTGFWMGRLVIEGGVVKMPRFGLFPFSVLPHREMRLDRVVRWGLGSSDAAYAGGLGGALVMAASGQAVLTFEVRHDDGGTSLMRIALGTYPGEEAGEIYGHLECVLGRPERMEMHWLWGLQLAGR